MYLVWKRTLNAAKEWDGIISLESALKTYVTITCSIIPRHIFTPSPSPDFSSRYGTILKANDEIKHRDAQEHWDSKNKMLYWRFPYPQEEWQS
jgi:hypothetical protein